MGIWRKKSEAERVASGGVVRDLGGKASDMTVEDYFAGEVMQALIRAMADSGIRDAIYTGAQAAGNTIEDQLAMHAYNHARSMIAERARLNAGSGETSTTTMPQVEVVSVDTGPK